MILKSEIEKAFQSQQELIAVERNFIQRQYLTNYKPDKKHIEVLTGIRRCGKSTLMQQIANQFYKKVAYFNFEDSRVFGFEVADFQKLDEIMPKSTDAYFFDEIQNVEAWEIYIRQLHERGAKVFVTGSNASLLSRELGTRLTGRHLRHELFPFSFIEFLQFKKIKKSLPAIEKYVEQGGFPEFLESRNREVLQNLLKDIVLRDIAIRHSIKNTRVLMDITLFLISNIGKEYSFNNLKKTFDVGSANTVSNYLSWLEDAYLLFFLPRFSWSAKNTAVNPRKVYAIDNGLVNANSLSFSEDKGRLLENAVYQFLKQNSNYTLYYFREQKECDFVVFEKRNCKMLIQVCEIINGDNKKREIDGLLEAMQYFKMQEGIIITKNQTDILTIGEFHIKLIAAYDFFTEY